jgi:hypothetical protein
MFLLCLCCASSTAEQPTKHCQVLGAYLIDRLMLCDMHSRGYVSVQPAVLNFTHGAMVRRDFKHVAQW